MRFMRLSALAAVALLLVGARSSAAQTITGSAALKAQAKISGDSAMKIARAHVTNGTIKSGEIEREKGKLLYSFDLNVPGKSGVEEVHIDALTGAVLSTKHESAAHERAEARAEGRARGATRTRHDSTAKKP